MPPPPILRPALAHYLWVRGLSFAAVAPVFGCSENTVRRYCLPFSDRDRQVPGAEIMGRIVEWSEGEITAASFYPPELNGQAVTERVLQAGRSS